jgi:hypothetical protein
MMHATAHYDTALMSAATPTVLLLLLSVAQWLPPAVLMLAATTYSDNAWDARTAHSPPHKTKNHQTLRTYCCLAIAHKQVCKCAWQHEAFVPAAEIHSMQALHMEPP